MVLWPLFLEILTIPPRVSGVASGETPGPPQISDSPNPLFWPAEVKKRWGEVFDARLASKWLKTRVFRFFLVDFVKFDEKSGLWSKNCLFLPFLQKSRKSSRKWPSEMGWKTTKHRKKGNKRKLMISWLKKWKMAAVPGHKKVDLAIALRSERPTRNKYICITEHPLTPTLHS